MLLSLIEKSSSCLRTCLFATRASFTPFLSPSAQPQSQVRGAKRMTFRPNAWKRLQKHGLEKRLSTPAGRAVLWRRVLKGRHNLHT
ncbi:hypothetical protein EB796_002961 [Bugula neritina]|uniref:Large ribosomal subunit protein bL34m n=1 Tax=Bugula neritina TaxID=10212 RepID=A0A7J7KLQ6_BUGNE|nr:hypothetical protein EB796_002961 [Bugula neritina]